VTGQIFASAAPDPLPEEGDQTSGIRIRPPPPSPTPPPPPHQFPIPPPRPHFFPSHRRGMILYLEYHSVCPLVRIGSALSLSRKRVCPPLRKQGGSATLACGERGWADPIRTTGEKAWHSVYSVPPLVSSPVFYTYCLYISNPSSFLSPVPTRLQYFVCFLSILIFLSSMLYIRANSPPPPPRASRDVHDIIII
jgi:hypothetical protein